MPEKKRYAENAPGPFYVEHDMCIQCGYPESVSPTLVQMNDNHCYFAKQPTTVAELEDAIRAVQSCCCGAYRYSGSDSGVISRLDADTCDDSGR